MQAHELHKICLSLLAAPITSNWIVPLSIDGDLPKDFPKGKLYKSKGTGTNGDDETFRLLCPLKLLAWLKKHHESLGLPEVSE